MAQIIKLSDFLKTDQLSDKSNIAFDKNFNFHKKEATTQETGRRSAFEDALNNVREALKETRDIKKTLEETPNLDNLSNFQFSLKNKNASQGEQKEYYSSLSSKINQGLNEIASALKNLKNHPSAKKTGEKIDHINTSMLLSATVTMQELFSKLSAMLNQINSAEGSQLTLTQKNHNPKEKQAMASLKSAVQDLKDLIMKDFNVFQNTVLIGSEQNAQIKKTDNKEKRIWNVKIDSNVEKKGTDIQAAKNTPVKELNIGEQLRVNELKEKLQGRPAVEQKVTRKEAGEQNFQKKQISERADDLTLKEKNNQLTLNQKADFSKQEIRFEDIQKTDSVSKAELGKQILNQIGEKVSGFVGKNFSHLTVELKPETLGTVKIVLDLKQDNIKGTIIVDNPQVKEILKENMDQVKAILQDSGVNLTQLNIATKGEQSGQSFQQQEKQDKYYEMVAQNQKLFSVMNDSTKSYEKTVEDNPFMQISTLYLKA